MRIPARLLEHPVEALIASILLLTLLVAPADFKPSGETAPNAVAQKL